MPTTAKSALPYPALTDSPNGPLQVGNLAAGLDAKVKPHFANIAARNAAFPSPVAGDHCSVGGALHIYTGTRWTWRNENYVTGTTDVNGALVIPHGLGVTPVTWGGRPADQGNDLLNRVMEVKPGNADSANIVLRAVRTDTSVWMGNQLLGFHWFAVA